MAEKEPTDNARDQVDLLQETALALLRVDMNLLSQPARREARVLLGRAADKFDGRRLVELCLEDGSVDDKTLEKAMLSLRSRLIGHQTHVPRKRPGSFVRFTATLMAKLVFFGLYTFLVLVAVFLVKRNWDHLDLYVIGDKLLSLTKF
jgi:hypothetical protein